VLRTSRRDRHPRPPSLGARVAALWCGVCALALPLPAPAAAQDANFLLPIPEIEERLRSSDFRIIDWRGARAQGDRTQRAVLGFDDDSTVLVVQWANAAPGGSEFNNEPRYEAAAYEIQKLFLDPAEYVVPPTAIRAFSHNYVTANFATVRPTFREAQSVVVVLQYWLSQVTPDNYWDRRRADSDSVYARHIGNFNILTYLIRHNDANIGNFVISQYDENPRVFAVDNGVAFAAPESDRGYEWRMLQVRRLPEHTVERLRGITRADLDAALGVIAEFEVRDGLLVAVPPGENLSRNSGVRRRDGRIQFGLTAREIGAIESRLRSLLNQVDRGRIQTF
jgi:hypothetical protein